MNFMGPGVYAPPSAMSTLRRSSSSVTRKRSMPGMDPARLSFTSRKSESDKDLLSLVPVGVVFMEQVVLDLTVSKDAHADVRYVLGVRHLKSNATWSHVRSFDDYRKFQQRLLKVIDHGHFCSAECPWLYTFLKSYFPKKHLFHFATSRVVASRKEALQRFFVSLQSFLLNRANHSCSVVATAVVDEVVQFVYGDNAEYYQLGGDADNQRESLFTKAPAGPEMSACVEDDDTSTASGSSASSPTLHCSLCESSLEGEAYASSRRSLSTTFVGAASSSSLMEDEPHVVSASAPAVCSALSAAVGSNGSNFSTGSSSSSRGRGTHYVMTLGCGHQFHDECIVPKLNETLRCPTCDHLEVK